jgi:hypothetical protein
LKRWRSQSPFGCLAEPVRRSSYAPIVAEVVKDGLNPRRYMRKTLFDDTEYPSIHLWLQCREASAIERALFLQENGIKSYSKERITSRDVNLVALNYPISASQLADVPVCCRLPAAACQLGPAPPCCGAYLSGHQPRNALRSGITSCMMYNFGLVATHGSQ